MFWILKNDIIKQQDIPFPLARPTYARALPWSMYEMLPAETPTPAPSVKFTPRRSRRPLLLLLFWSFTGLVKKGCL